ncbi:MAG TPA: NAD-dependent epimerase/dehydratase family protein [Pirellulales bacterium]|nr:NAD-dependent epimerase/dehydratase family protein [Pirellulales bacterium]
MNILVTGATGFLGTALCERLRDQGHGPVALGSRDCDLTDPRALDRFNRDRFDQIYHLAAWTQAGDFCLSHPGEQWIINQQINTNVLAWWQAQQPQAKLIAMGTSCAYAPDTPLIEDRYLEGVPSQDLLSYAMTKRMLYVGLASLHRQFGLDYLCLVPSTLYGPGYHGDGRQMHFIFDLMRKIVHAERTGEPAVLWGDGHQRRELVLVDDFALLAIQLAATVSNELVNVGAGEEYSIRHFARLICDKVGYDFGLVQYDTSKYVGTRSKCLSVEKLRQLVPSLQMTTLDEGISRTVDWYCALNSHRELAV